MSLDISATGYVAFRFAGDAFVGFNVATCSQIVFCAVRFACNLDITAACQAAFYSCQIDIGGYYAPGAGQIDFQLGSFYFLFQKNIAAACHVDFQFSDIYRTGNNEIAGRYHVQLFYFA